MGLVAQEDDRISGFFMLLTTIKLSGQIDCNTLCQKIQVALNRIGPLDNLDNKIMTINITDIIDSNSDIGPPKIEYKNLGDNT